MSRGPESSGRMRGGPISLLLVVLMFAGVIGAVVVVNGREGADPSGRDALPAVLAVVILGIVLIFINQAFWLRRATRADLRAAEERARAARAGGLADAGSATSEEVQAALAIGGDPQDQLDARRDSWRMARRSWGAGVVVTLWILVFMPVALLTGRPAVAVLGAIPVVLWAAIAGINVLRPGGQLDDAYELSDRIMAPLGLRTVERPRWILIPYATGELHGTVRGATVLGGERHGRHVEIELRGGRSAVAVASPARPFEVREAGGALVAGDDAPAGVRGAVLALESSPAWTDVRLTAGDGRIFVTRSRGGAHGWAHDLWLAERVADSCA